MSPDGQFSGLPANDTRHKDTGPHTSQATERTAANPNHLNDIVHVQMVPHPPSPKGTRPVLGPLPDTRWFDPRAPGCCWLTATFGRRLRGPMGMLSAPSRRRRGRGIGCGVNSTAVIALNLG